MLMFSLAGATLYADPWEEEPQPWHVYEKLYDIPPTQDKTPRYIWTGVEKHITAFFGEQPYSYLTFKNMQGVALRFVHEDKKNGVLEIDGIEHSLYDKVLMSKRYSKINFRGEKELYEYIIDGRQIPQWTCGKKPRITFKLNLEDNFRFDFKGCSDLDLKFSITPTSEILAKFDYSSDANFEITEMDKLEQSQREEEY